MMAGHVRWPADNPVWEFDWRLSAPPDSEGIAFTHVYYKGHEVLYKASLPMIRVQYDPLLIFGRPTAAGPYKDSLHAFNLKVVGAIPLTFAPPVAYEATSWGIRFMVVESTHRIGHYRLTNRWLFREDGVIQPQLYSAGLQFPSNHRHHVYWRFDFDIDGNHSDLALNRLDWWPLDWGFGKHWHPITEESYHHRPVSSGFRVLDTKTGRGYEIAPGPFDGESDDFSSEDFWVFRYHDNEDRRGAIGTPSDDQLFPMINNEPTGGQDVVVWYVAHLNHEAAEGGDEWHVCGPIIKPFGF